MKIGFFSESPADQAALAVFAEGLLGEPPEPVANMDLQGHGVTGVLGALDGVFRGLHYNSDAEGLVVVVDCDDAVLHDPSHDAQGGEEDCRLCKIRKIIFRARRQLKPRTGRPELKVAIGLAVPAIEAWYLVGKHTQVGEAAWKVALGSGKRPFDRRELKRLVYGTDKPSLERETECAVKEAQRIIRDLRAIEASFPVGFGLMAEEVRSWAAARPKRAVEEKPSGGAPTSG